MTEDIHFMTEEIEWEFDWEAQLVEELGREFKLFGPVIIIREQFDGPEPMPIKATPIAVDIAWKSYMMSDIVDELERRKAMLIISRIERSSADAIDDEDEHFDS